jgi:hypothetical protein
LFGVSTPSCLSYSLSGVFVPFRKPSAPVKTSYLRFLFLPSSPSPIHHLLLLTIMADYDNDNGRYAGKYLYLFDTSTF